MKWINIITLATLLLGASLLQAQKKELPLHFEDMDFEKNINRWYKVTESGEKVYHNVLYVNPDKDFRLVAEFESESVEGYGRWGISWGRADMYNYNHFEINAKKEFRMGYRKGLDFHAIEPWIKKKKLIVKGVNTLEVRRTGTTLTYLINDKEVYKTTYRRFKETAVAMRSTLREVKFKRFAIYQDMGEINLAEGVGNQKLEAENLGPNVNSKYVDKSPVISPDGKTLYFIREEPEDGFGLQDIYYSNYQEGTGWTEAKNIGRPLNNQSNNFINAVMPDNNTVMAINAYRRTDEEEILSFAYRTKEGWSYPTPRRIENLKKTGRWVSFDLASDGRTVIFSMKRPNTKGGRDLYVSFLQPNGHFSSPKNLGPTINTLGNEHCPSLAADGKTLYFDTDGHSGYGGRDIFMAKRLDDTWTNWSTPQNLGPQFNTKGSDEGLVVPASGEYAYFVSDNNSLGGLDIYRLKMPDELRPEPTAVLVGYVIDCKYQRGIPTTVHVYEEGRAAEIAYARTNPTNGEYKLALVGGKKYRIVVDYNPEMETASTDTIYIDLTDLEEYKEDEIVPICFQKKNTLSNSKDTIKIPIRAELPDFKSVYFEHNKHELTPTAKSQLDKMAQTMQAHPKLQLKVIGHTDSNGNNKYNWALAIKRSATVIAYLEEKGVERSRFDFKGYGETKPIANNETNQGRATNRRVEFELISKNS